MATDNALTEIIATGIPGLDEVLGGGLPKGGMYLLKGNPGVGKTTVALQFLLEAIRQHQAALYVSFAETMPELSAVAQAHRWDIEPMRIYGLTAAQHSSQREAGQTMFHPAEVELDEAINPLLEQVDTFRPARMVIDSVSEIRLLARDPLRYRRQLVRLKQFLAARNCTLMLVDDKVAERDDEVVQTIVHGIIALEKTTPVYGTTRRRLSVDKLRGVHYREGFHDYQIRTGGVTVFPRLVAAEHNTSFTEGTVSSGISALDTLLAGGLQRGSSALLLGAAGTGKSALAGQYATAAAARGEKAVIFSYEESVANWRARACAIGGAPLTALDSGALSIEKVDPSDLSPGQFSSMVRRYVEEEGARLVVIDSLNGYLQSVPGENFLLLHMHELLAYLAQRGVTSILSMAQHGLVGSTMHSPVDVSYLADTVMMLRYFEAHGRVRQVISVVKKRTGAHERTLREFSVDAGGVHVGAPLSNFQGVLTGVPVLHSEASARPIEPPR